MRPITALALVAAPLFAVPAQGQAVLSHQSGTLDSARAEVFDAVSVLHDSLQSVLGATARLQRDHSAQSDSWLLSRARAMTGACERSLRTLPRTRPVIAAGRWDGAYPRQKQARLLETLERLATTLEDCVTRWKPRTRGENLADLRDRGRSDAREVRDTILEYERDLTVFLKSIDIQGVPRTGRGVPAPKSSVEKR